MSLSMEQQGTQNGVTPMLFFLSLVLAAVLSGGGIFFWHRTTSEQARLILEKNIEDIQTQRDLVLGQRAGLQFALSALQTELRELKGEEAD